RRARTFSDVYRRRSWSAQSRLKCGVIWIRSKICLKKVSWFRRRTKLFPCTAAQAAIYHHGGPVLRHLPDTSVEGNEIFGVMLYSEGSGLSAIGQVQLTEQAADVVSHSPFAQKQPSSNVPIGQAIRNQRQHPHFLNRQIAKN